MSLVSSPAGRRHEASVALREAGSLRASDRGNSSKQRGRRARREERTASMVISGSRTGVIFLLRMSKWWVIKNRPRAFEPNRWRKLSGADGP